LQGMVLDALGDRAAFARWFAGHATQPKYPEVDWRPEEPVTPDEVRALLAAGAVLARNPASRFAFVRQPEDAVLLGVDGQVFDCPGDMAALTVRLCDQTTVTPEADCSDDTMDLLVTLINSGALGVEQD
jgi:50S ribosomal protein L16 3-hydroxylase